LGSRNSLCLADPVTLEDPFLLGIHLSLVNLEALVGQQVLQLHWVHVPLSNHHSLEDLLDQVILEALVGPEIKILSSKCQTYKNVYFSQYLLAIREALADQVHQVVHSSLLVLAHPDLLEVQAVP